MDGIGYSGLAITPYFDSMIVKYTVLGSNFQEAVRRMQRVLQECRIRGVKTNIGFLMNVLSHPQFASGIVTTSFIDDHPQLKQTSTAVWDFASEEQADPRKTYESERLLRYLGTLAVNGHSPELGADPTKLTTVSASSVPSPQFPTLSDSEARPDSFGWRKILLEEGPSGFSRAVRAHKTVLVTDCTWRDAHQSLLATRMRTQEVRMH
jgi:pyruvate carboxylase